MTGKRVVTIALLVLALGVLAGCGSPPEQVLTAKGSGQQVTLEPGAVFAIQLASNPTTGYKWELLENSDEKVLGFLDQKFESYPAGKGLVGAGGTETWRFKAAGRGKASLKLGYLRPWEKGVAPIETFSLQVEVR